MKTSNNRTVDAVMLDVDWYNWGLVLQMGSFDSGKVLTPQWIDMPEEGMPDTAQTKIPISDKALQKLSNTLWKRGFVPEGLTVQVIEDRCKLHKLPVSVRRRLHDLVGSFNEVERPEGDSSEMFWEGHSETVLVGMREAAKTTLLAELNSLHEVIEFLDEEDRKRNTPVVNNEGSGAQE